MSNKEEFYKNLKVKLDENTVFPSDYMYKFIVPTDKNQLEEVKEVFKEVKTKMSTKNSKSGKYVSISVVLNVKNSDEVINYYQSVTHIEGLLSL